MFKHVERRHRRERQQSEQRPHDERQRVQLDRPLVLVTGRDDSGVAFSSSPSFVIGIHF
jgi:hypothetical protein